MNYNHQKNSQHRLIGAILCLQTAYASSNRVNEGIGLAQVNLGTEDVFGDIGDFIIDAGESTIGAIGDIPDVTVDGINYIGMGIGVGTDFLADGFIKTGTELVDLGVDAYKWSDQAFTDANKWYKTATGEIEDWFESAADDVADWSIGAIDDIEEWSSGAAIDVTYWSIKTAQDFSERATDLIDRMGKGGKKFLDEIEDLYNDVEDWSVGAAYTIKNQAEDFADMFMKLDDLFIELGKTAADLYKKAENAVGMEVADLIALGDAVLAECVKVGALIKSEFNKLNAWTIQQIEVLNKVLKVAGQKLEEFGDDIYKSAAGQKTVAFTLGFVEEVSKVGEHLYKSTDKIIKKIESDGLHVVLADAIDHVGDAAIHFTTETFLNEVGGTAAKVVTIPLTTVMMLLGLEEQGNAMKGWIDGAIKDMSVSIEDAMESQIELYSTLFRDPKEFVDMIEENPLRIASFIYPAQTALSTAQFTFAEDQVTNFFEIDGSLTDLPKQWF